MRRRDVLAAIGTGMVGSAAGCTLTGSGDGTDSSSSPDDTASSSGDAPFEHPGTIDESFPSNGDYPTDDDPSDGLPPAFPDPPAAPDVDESTFDTMDVNGETVRLAPIDVVEKWYRRADARFVDARGLSQYKRAHVYGSVLSTAQEGSSGGGIDGWSTDDRIVTYCGCPHHLSSLRAAGFQKAGFERVYAIDEGFGPWADREYPMAGTAFGAESQAERSEWVVPGVVDPDYAGEFAWAAADDQYEAAPIEENGEFTLRLKFAGVTARTPVRVSTPAFTVTRPLGELAAGVLAE